MSEKELPSLIFDRKSVFSAPGILSGNSNAPEATCVAARTKALSRSNSPVSATSIAVLSKKPPTAPNPPVAIDNITVFPYFCIPSSTHSPTSPIAFATGDITPSKTPAIGSITAFATSATGSITNEATSPTAFPTV